MNNDFKDVPASVNDIVRQNRGEHALTITTPAELVIGGNASVDIADIKIDEYLIKEVTDARLIELKVGNKYTVCIVARHNGLVIVTSEIKRFDNPRFLFQTSTGSVYHPDKVYLSEPDIWQRIQLCRKLHVMGISYLIGSPNYF